MMNLKHAMLAAALVVGPLSATQANAATLVINVAGAEGWGDQGDPANTFVQYLLGAGAHITAVSYSVNITANSPSWLEEAVFGFGSSSGNGVFLSPGVGDDFSGTASYSGSGDLVALGLDFFLDGDGLLTTEFFESFTDGSEPDSLWNSGTITITYNAATAGVPEPATWAMMMIGFGAMGAAMRRRPKVRVRYAA